MNGAQQKSPEILALGPRPVKALFSEVLVALRRLAPGSPIDGGVEIMQAEPFDSQRTLATVVKALLWEPQDEQFVPLQSVTVRSYPVASLCYGWGLIELSNKRVAGTAEELVFEHVLLVIVDLGCQLTNALAKCLGSFLLTIGTEQSGEDKSSKC